MKSRPLARAAAIGLFLTAIFTLAGFAAHPPLDPARMAGMPWRLSHIFLWIGAAAGAVGVVGLSVYYRPAAGRLGATGGVLATFGFVVLMGAYLVETFVLPGLSREAPALLEGFPAGDVWAPYRITVALSSIAVGIGVVLLVVGLLRTQLPRWAITAVGIGALGAGVSFVLPRPFSLGAVGILALGLVGVGYRLWTEPSPSNLTRSM